MRVNRKNKDLTTLLTIMFLSQLCYEIKWITARSSSSNSRHGAHSTHQQNFSEEEDDPLVDGESAEIHSQLLKHSLNLEKVPSPRLSVKLHSDFTLECEAVGSPPPVVYWTKNGKYMKASGHKSGMKYLNRIRGSFSEQSEQKISSTSYGSENKGLRLGAVTSKLQLRCIRPEDEAEYSCVADNGGEKVLASTTLVIEEDDISGKVTPECELRLFNFMFHKNGKRRSAAYIKSWETFHVEQIGNDVVLSCRSGGHPRPKIRWTGNEGQEIVFDNKFYVSPRGDLLIKNLSWSEMGEYTCMVENSFGSDVGSTFLYPLLEEDPG